jgi:alcohol dehydrogenase class IV
MDALSQAIEAHWSINSNEESKKYSSEAIKLAINNLDKAVNNSSEDSRLEMSKASNLAGKAINLTKTTAPHAISYSLTSNFGVPHGHAVALTLPSILVYNSEINKKDCLDKRGVDYARKTTKEITNLLECKSEIGAKNKLTNLMRNIGLETNLRKLGISDLEIIIKEINLERLKNNPRLLTESNLRGILKELL